MSEPDPMPSPLGFDVAAVRRDFPILSRKVKDKDLVYLDSAATAQKPQAVLDAIIWYYSECNANVHRGAHFLSEQATAAYEDARVTVQKFLKAGSSREIVFVRGTTEAVNLVAQSFVRPRVGPGDEILVTEMEHHSNIVPWQIVREQTGAVLRVLPMDDRGELRLDLLPEMLTEKTKFFSLTHVSNALGTVNPLKEILAQAKAAGVPTLVDAAQSAPHLEIDVRELGCDFLAFSGHKAYGPMGIGALYGRAELLAGMQPYQGGGEMISTVTFDETTYNEVPHKFEAGTPNVAGAVGLAAALDYLTGLDRVQAAAHEEALLKAATEAVAEIKGLRIIGEAKQKASVLSFVIDGIHPHDIGTILDFQGVAIRTGQHCAEPVMQHFGIPASARASFGIYNTLEEVDAFLKGLLEVVEVMG